MQHEHPGSRTKSVTLKDPGLRPSLGGAPAPPNPPIIAFLFVEGSRCIGGKHNGPGDFALALHEHLQSRCRYFVFFSPAPPPPRRPKAR